MLKEDDDEDKKELLMMTELFQFNRNKFLHADYVVAVVSSVSQATLFLHGLSMWETFFLLHSMGIE